MTVPDLPPADRPGNLARRVVARHLGRLRRHEAGALDGRDPEDLHRARVATRRLRAALRLFAAEFPEGIRLRLTIELRRLGRQLGGVRDLDVQLERLESQRKQVGPEVEAGISELVGPIVAAREAARGRLRRAMAAPRYARLLGDIDAWVAGDDAGEGDSLAPELSRAHRRFRKAGKIAARRPGARTLHDLRIRTKRLRYALEFLDERAGTDGRNVAARLTRLQELLGGHQDAVVGARLVRRALRAGVRRPVAIALEALLAEEVGLARRARVAFLDRWPGFASRTKRKGTPTAASPDICWIDQRNERALTSSQPSSSRSSWRPFSSLP